MLLANPASYGENFDPRGPYEPDLPGPPAKDHAGLWFLTNTALLIGAPPEKIRQTLYYRRSSELMEGFRIRDPYAVCAAYLLLERDGDVLVDLNMLTAAVVLCAERHLPWGADEAYSYAEPYGNGTPIRAHSMLYGIFHQWLEQKAGDFDITGILSYITVKGNPVFKTDFHKVAVLDTAVQLFLYRSQLFVAAGIAKKTC